MCTAPSSSEPSCSAMPGPSRAPAPASKRRAAVIHGRNSDETQMPLRSSLVGLFSPSSERARGLDVGRPQAKPPGYRHAARLATREIDARAENSPELNRREIQEDTPVQLSFPPSRARRAIRQRPRAAQSAAHQERKRASAGSTTAARIRRAQQKKHGSPSYGRVLRFAEREQPNQPGVRAR